MELELWWRDEWEKGNKDKAVTILETITKLQKRRLAWLFSNGMNPN